MVLFEITKCQKPFVQLELGLLAMRVLVLLAFFLLLPMRCFAGYVFTVAPSSFLPEQANTLVSADLFLTATESDTLYSASALSFNLNAAAGAGNTTFTGFTPDNALLGGGIMSNFTVTASQIQFNLFRTTPGPNGAVATSNQLRLGSVNFQLGADGSNTALTFADRNTGTSDLIVYTTQAKDLAQDPRVIDALVSSNAGSLNITAVPEPSSMVLCVGALWFVFRGRVKKFREPLWRAAG